MTHFKANEIKACVFDAYGTLFDASAAAKANREALGDKTDQLAQLWRTKQLEYTWLRSLMGRFQSFWQVTGDALDYSMASLKIEDVVLRAKLMSAYFELAAYPEVKETLRTLKQKSLKCAILSNGERSMLTAAARNADIIASLDAIYSVDKLEIFKPHPSVYQLAVDGLRVEPHEICFMSSNAWDVAGAANFGFRVVWVNRFGQEPERLDRGAERMISDLSALPALFD